MKVKDRDWLQVIPGKAPPEYVKQMREILEEAWGNAAAMKALKDKPTAVFKAKGLLPEGSPVTIYSHPEGPNEFHFPIPEKDDELGPQDLTFLAAHLIRCCSEC